MLTHVKEIILKTYIEGIPNPKIKISSKTISVTVKNYKNHIGEIYRLSTA